MKLKFKYVIKIIKWITLKIVHEGAYWFMFIIVFMTMKLVANLRGRYLFVWMSEFLYEFFLFTLFFYAK